MIRQQSPIVVVALTCLLLGASTPAEERGDATPPNLTFDGFGPAKVGMTIGEAKAALKVELAPEELRAVASGDPAQRCNFYSSRALPGVHFMVLDGRVARVDVTRPRKGVSSDKYQTAAGAHLGMAEIEVKRLHPTVIVEPHPYVSDGHYLRATSSDGKYALIFETDGKVVTSYRGGLKEAVGLIEGCE